MEEQRYLISDAAKIVEVEAHVLRYWEEELELSISRTELGHRYYTRENIETFLKVKDLREKGLQLKAIKTILKGLENFQIRYQSGQDESEHWETAIQNVKSTETDEKTAEAQKSPSGSENGQEEASESEKERVRETADSVSGLQILQENTEKLKHFERLVETIVDRVVKENNEVLEEHIEVTFSREMDYLVHMQEQREEERYRRLDESIRQHQNRQMVAAAKESRWYQRLKRLRKKM